MFDDKRCFHRESIFLGLAVKSARKVSLELTGSRDCISLQTRDSIAKNATPPPPPAAAENAAPAAEGAAAEPATDAMDTEMDTITPAAEAVPDATLVDSSNPRFAPVYQERWTKLKSILSGEAPIGLHLHFLSSHNKADLLILKGIKDAVETRNSVCHSATILANALMHAGTTVDMFLRCAVASQQWTAQGQLSPVHT